MLIIAGTGHRPSRMGNEYSMRGPISTYVKGKIREILLQEKPCKVISGMALGFDTILAMTALDMNIPIIAAIPFRGQENRWTDESKRLYKQILADPNVTVKEICEPGYDVKKMFIRDRWMVDNANVVLAYWDGVKYGGTYATINYASRCDKRISYIDPFQYQEML